MRKSTLFISAALTTFMLAVLFGVVSGYKKAVNNASQQTTAAEVAAAAAPATEAATAAPTADAVITPEQAVALAGQVLGHTDVYSVETSVWNGTNAYLVTFVPGDLVYVGLDGQILSVTPAPSVVYVNPPAAQGNNGGKHHGGGGGGGGGGGEGGEHEGGD